MEKLAFCIAAGTGIIILLIYSKRWEEALQDLMAREGKKKFGNTGGWDRPLKGIVARIMSLIWGLAVISVIYSLIFGPIQN
jgi:hypothetical protein